MNSAGLAPGEITSNAYPAPPRVNWVLLLIASCALDALAEMILPKPYSGWISGLFLDGWAVYLCIWLRKLDPAWDNIGWCIAIVATEVLGKVIGDFTPHSSWLEFFSMATTLAGIVIYLLLIFSIRDAILQHYNEREPVGLTLSPWLTLFFSFYYFQYHLYPIAQFKDRVARGEIANPGRTLLS
jgi:hypothetical protein